MKIVEGGNVRVECTDSGKIVEGIVVTRSSKQVRINMAGVAMTFRANPKGEFWAQQSGMSFVIRTV
ncbi:hypothetical protein [Chachezhania antarctica]|uniref:hypothetical protein n=1 Tax=Chachezhania antarctica TaxID=2340860 RepID=UPI000EAF3F37|nr:hypothetical protein [Chachezhania antarctica]|tara:strand:- start:5286 stop:5483 length:198 start_codon:yes stop_codon:yes gene_type:complete